MQNGLDIKNDSELYQNAIPYIAAGITGLPWRLFRPLSLQAEEYSAKITTHTRSQAKATLKQYFFFQDGK